MKATKPKKTKALKDVKGKFGLTEKGKRDRELYVAWKSIPAMLRLLPDSEKKKMGYDVDDPVFQQLVLIQTKLDFTKVFGVGNAEPYRWEKEEGFEARVNELSMAQNVMKFRKDVDFSFTQKVLKHGDAARTKLWKQLYEGWTEKSEVTNKNLNIDAKSLQALIEERNKKQWAAADALDEAEA